MKATKIQSMVRWNQPLKNSRLVCTLHVIWTIRSLFSKINQTNPQNLFSNWNKLVVILSINLQLYNHYKYMIIFIKMQKQNTPKKTQPWKVREMKNPSHRSVPMWAASRGRTCPDKSWLWPGTTQTHLGLSQTKIWIQGVGGEKGGERIILSVALMKQVCSL